METTVKVRCPIPGMESVILHFDMMRPQEDYDQYMLTKGAECQDIITDIEGWDPDKWGGGPHDKCVPMAFRLWMIGGAVGSAIKTFGADPNLRKGS